MQGTPYFRLSKTFIEWLRRLGYASGTLPGYERQLRRFLHWLKSQQIDNFSQVTQPDLEAYVRWLHTRQNQVLGGALSSSYIQNHVNIIRLLDKYLQATGQGKVQHGKLVIEKGLPYERTILIQQEVQALYAATEDSLLGYRDRAMLGLYYGCGLRKTEGERVKVAHLHQQKRLLEVLPGKNGKGRYVPISAGVMQDFTAYLRYSRPYLGNSQPAQLMVAINGRPLQGDGMATRFKQLVEKARIEKQISLHSLRHSIATHLLQSGMTLEQIRRFLGHTSLNSTQIYTRITDASI